MGRPRQSSVSSFESGTTESDASGGLGDDTDLTDLGSESEDEEPREDIALLEEDRELPDDYWRRRLDQLNEEDFEDEDYHPDTTVALDRVEAQWKQ